MKSCRQSLIFSSLRKGKWRRLLELWLPRLVIANFALGSVPKMGLGTASRFGLQIRLEQNRFRHCSAKQTFSHVIFKPDHGVISRLIYLFVFATQIHGERGSYAEFPKTLILLVWIGPKCFSESSASTVRVEEASKSTRVSIETSLIDEYTARVSSGSLQQNEKEKEQIHHGNLCCYRYRKFREWRWNPENDLCSLSCNQTESWFIKAFDTALRRLWQK